MFIIDALKGVEAFMPEQIRQEAVRLRSVERVKSSSSDLRMTMEETLEYHRLGQERLDLLRDQARLVITGRFHAAVPAMAMGIPVILVKNSFDPRFNFLQKFLPLYTPDRFHEIDWDPAPVDLEKEKQAVKEAFFSAVRFASARRGIIDALDTSKCEQKVNFAWGLVDALPTVPFPANGKFRYAVWGVCLHASQIAIEEIQKQYKDAELFAAIDTYQSGEYMGRPIIQPDSIGQLPEDVIVLVPAPSAHQAAMQQLGNTTRRFVLLKGASAKCYHFA